MSTIKLLPLVLFSYLFIFLRLYVLWNKSDNSRERPVKVSLKSVKLPEETAQELMAEASFALGSNLQIE